MKTIWLALALTCSGQTQLSWKQLQSGGTRPRAVWQAGLPGQRIHPAQVRPLPLGFAIEGTNVLRIFGLAADSCAVTTAAHFTGLLEVVAFEGQVGILAGRYAAGTVYTPTSAHTTITGPCVPVDAARWHYPRGIQAVLYLAYIGTSGARGVETPFLPTSYGLNMAGLVRVNGRGGLQVEWKP